MPRFVQGRNLIHSIPSSDTIPYMSHVWLTFWLCFASSYSFHNSPNDHNINILKIGKIIPWMYSRRSLSAFQLCFQKATACIALFAILAIALIPQLWYHLAAPNRGISPAKWKHAYIYSAVDMHLTNGNFVTVMVLVSESCWLISIKFSPKSIGYLITMVPISQ